MSSPRFGVRELVFLVLFPLPLALLVLPFAAPALYKPGAEPTAEQLQQARDAFGRRGGSYQYGTDPRTDYAIDKYEAIIDFLKQATDSNVGFDECVQQLCSIFEDAQS